MIGVRTAGEGWLRSNEKIDLVYGHNDPMAYGAYLAAKDAGREGEMKFIGIDALPNEGVMWVHNGELTATMKVRRAKVIENFKHHIDELYAGKEDAP